MRERNKLSVIGAGNVGATAAHLAAGMELADVILLDIVDGMPAGKALDLAQAAPVQGYNSRITGGTDYDATTDSDVVILTAGLPRRPGMSRDDLLVKNTNIVAEVTRQVVSRSPEAVLIIVANPLDVMVHVAATVSGFPTARVVGMAGVLDTARFRTFIGQELGVSVEDIQAMLMGGHGDDMVPLPRYTCVSGVPLTELLSAERIEAIVARTRKGGGEIVALLGTGSAYYAPAAAAVQMARAVLKDQHRLLPCCAYCEKEYAVGGSFVGVPAVLGAGGVERVIELQLTESEGELFQKSVEHVKKLTAKADKILGETLKC